MSMSRAEASDKCFGQDSCIGCQNLGDTCDGSEKYMEFQELDDKLKGEGLDVAELKRHRELKFGGTL